ncbi:DNA primase [Candidatus Aerophobetes bacterium]|nr:DNA primase [Candidatus Aerophobetes bacterium]
MGRYISPDTIDQICQQTDIVQIISEYIPLTSSGKNYKALCPFHEEKTPSFVVSPEKQVFHCFGCGAGGNLFTFLMKWENVAFPEAVRMVAQKVGVSLSLDEKVTDYKQKLYQINSQVTEFFHQQLKKNKTALSYLYKRGFKSDSIDLFKLGWAPFSQSFLSFCKKNDLPQDGLKELGLTRTSSSGEIYPYFRERIMFPVVSLSGKVVGFGARVLDDSLPKYINSSASSLFDKGRILYGLHVAQREARKSREVILVEGYTDVISLHQEGIHNVVASLGTSLTTSQIRLLRRYVDTVFLAYDQDSAGEAATIRGVDLLLENELQVKVISFPGEKDPADFIREKGKKALLQAKQKALPYIQYRIEATTGKDEYLPLEKKLEIVNSLFFTLKKVKSRYQLDDMLRRLSQALDFNEESLRSEFRRFCEEKYKFSFSPTLKFEVPEEEEIEKRLLEVMLCSQKAIEVARATFSPDSFTSPLCRRLAQEIFLCQSPSNITPAYLINRTTDENLSSLISSLSLNDSSLEGFDLEQLTREIAQALKRRSHQKRIEQLRRMIKDCERQGEEEKVKSLCRELVQLRRSILI